MKLIFPTDYASILERINRIDPVRYGKNRNFVDGAVTYLSPYISRGVISTKQVLQSVLSKGHDLRTIESFVKELCWRDYFQRVGQVKDLNTEIRFQQEKVLNDGVPTQILRAATGIEGIDTAIETLYETGYMHNHCRMYTASLVCNIAGSHWKNPAAWMYYHLLDGDWASNICSWQWVCGANSSKKYYANQENINKYTHTNQSNTCLDKSYEALPEMEVPDSLKQTEKFNPLMDLPPRSPIHIDADLPLFIYNYYNLDPLWHKDEPGNRILLLDPSFFYAYPVSKKCLDFILGLSKNISGIQVFTGSFQELTELYSGENIYYKEHPLNTGYQGVEEPREWIAPGVSGYYPSFFAYWKKIEKILY